MFILTALVGAASRQVGRVANTLFGWAVLLLFGKVPENKQVWLSVVAFGAIAWIALLLGVIFPNFGLFLIALVPRPGFVSETMVRIAMLAGAIILPPIIGAISGLVLAEKRETGGALVKTILRGYPYALALAITLVVLVIYVPYVKIVSLAKRWEDQHLAVMVKPDAYDGVVEDVRAAVRQAGLDLDRQKAPFMLRLPPHILAVVGGASIAAMVANNLAMLRGRDRQVEALLYPSDLYLRGKKDPLGLARSTIVRQLTFGDAYLTWTKQANEIEDKLRAVWLGVRGKQDKEAQLAALEQIDGLQQEIDHSSIEYEEWQVLYREKLEFEEQLLQALAGTGKAPEEPKQSVSSALGTTVKPVKQGLSPADLVAATPALPAVGALGIGGVLLWYMFRSR